MAEEKSGLCPQEYPFPDDPEERGYLLFPYALENDPNVAFHGTTEEKLRSIAERGFEIGGELPSNSFARTSSTALGYACENRTETSRGCVIAVRFDDLTARGLDVGSFVIHRYEGGPQPTIIGCCIVPATYRHV